MVLEETLKHHFQTLGVNVEDKSVLGKCLDLCDLYDVSEETLVEMWVAFMVEKDTGMQPTLDLLGQMERTVLKTDKNILDVRTKTNSSVPIVESPRINQQYADNDDILGMYGYKGEAPLETAPQGSLQVSSQVKRLRSPDAADDSIARESKIRALGTNFASISQKSATPRRIIGGETVNIIHKCGRDVIDWKNTIKSEFRIAKTDDPHVQPQDQYMFEIVSNKVSSLKRVCQTVGSKLCDVWSHIKGEDAPPPTTSDVRMQSDAKFRTWGRISFESEEPSATSVILEGCKMLYTHGIATTVQVDLTNVPKYSIFPGQIVAVEGTNPTGNLLLAQRLFTSGYVPNITCEPMLRPNIDENMHVVVAAGPFTDREDFDYKPLLHLMDYVVEMEPHVLILIGPFVPANHTAIEDATILVTYQELFEQIIEKIMKYIKGKCTQVVLIPSSNDAHHDPVYPTPEFFLPQSLRNSNLHLMTDPCMLDIEGLTIGITSTDVIRHLSKVEISRNMAPKERLPRMMDHVLSQGCFYPLYPSSTEVNVDTPFWVKYAMLHRRPHILIIPSDLQHIAKWLDDCFVINPQRLNKRTYARMIVRPTCDKTWSHDNIDCEILKI